MKLVSNFSLKKKLYVSSALLSFTLTACGGGGGGGGTTPVDPDPGSVSQADFNQGTYFRDSIRADFALNANITGTGVVVGLVDDGIDVDHPYLQHAISDLSIDLSGNDLSDASYHGTAMAGLIVGNDQGLGTLGIAPDATLIAVDASDTDVFEFDDLGNAINYLTDNNAQIINLSLGLATTNYDLTSPDVVAITRATENDVIVFAATGNLGATYNFASDPAYYAGLDQFNGLFVAVTAVDENNQIASFAQPCVIENPYYCIAAPGVDVITTSVGGGLELNTSGTSQATAIASGSMATLLQYFPNLTPQDAVEILLTTATDLGAVGVDDIYGSGLINLEAALQPIGTTTMSTGQAVTADQTYVIGKKSNTAQALSNAEALREVAIFDDYNREYSTDLTGRFAVSENSFDFYDAWENYEVDLGLELGFAGFDEVWVALGNLNRNRWAQDHLLFVNSDLFANSFVDLANLDLEFGVKGSYDNTSYILRHALDSENLGDNNVNQIGISQEIGSNLRLSLAYSQLQENDQFLSVQLGDVLGAIDGATTEAIQLGAKWVSGDYSAFVRGTIAQTDVKFADDSGVYQAINDLESTAWAIGFGKENLFSEKDRIDFSVAQSLRITKGVAEFNPDVIVSDDVDLKETGQELTYEVAYGYDFTENFGVSLNLAYIDDPNHDYNAESEWGIGARLTYEF